MTGSRPATRALYLVVVLACLGTVQRVAAAGMRLEWKAPPECPDRAELESRVERLVGDSVQSNFRAATEVTRAGDSYRALVRTTSPAGAGERVLEGLNCDVLAESVALVIALSVAPGTRVGDASRERLVAAGSAHVSALTGTLPSTAIGFGAALAVEGILSLRLELRGTFHLGQSARFEGSPQGANFSLFSFAARGCRLWKLGGLELGPCIGADLQRMAATGFGGDSSLSGNATYWGPALGLFGRVRVVRGFAIHLAAEGFVPLSRRRFIFFDVGELHRASRVALQLLVAPELLF